MAAPAAEQSTMAAPPPPALPDELVEEILLRLPPDEPACLLRASLVCKSWGSDVSRPGFRRRLQELHRAPPLLGFLHNQALPPDSRFVPATASSFSLAAPDCASWRALDCRHGRALFLSQAPTELLLWEPVTGVQQRVPLPEGLQPGIFAGAVLCALAGGCDHVHCHGGPFRVVVAFNVREIFDDYGTVACVYSSETGRWGEPIWVPGEFDMDSSCCCSVLTRTSLLYFISSGYILEYDLARHDMSVIDTPDFESPKLLSLVLAEDGEMRVCQQLHQRLKLWKLKPNDDPDGPDSDTQWVLTRDINLANLPQIGAVLEGGTRVVGFAEGSNLIFVDTVAGIFTVDLQSEKERKVCDKRVFCNLIPVVSFYTPVHRGEHQDPLSSGTSEEAGGGEDGGEKEKAIEHPQQLFDKGCNAIEEGDFVNAYFSHALRIRVPSHGEVALKCASTEYGCALLLKAQVINDPLDNVPKSASNEESVTGTTSKYAAGNSKTFCSNVEDATPSRKVLR